MAVALRVIGHKHAASEAQLVAAVRQGDDRAFEELFSRYRSRITGYVLGMVRDHARAEDITQEVFLSALRRLRDSERPIAFKPWIYEIARNACIDEWRRAKRSSEVSLNDDENGPASERQLVSKQPTPDAAVENKQRLVALRDAFRGLSENHHRILVMRELEGLSYKQICDRTGMSRPMVESTLFRARRRLSEEYAELTTGRRCQQVCEVIDRADSSTIRVLGVRARRQVALHLSHCEDCRRYARVAGADEALFRSPTLADKVAALLPFGWLGRRLAGRSGHAFFARHATGVSQYMGSVGSTALLGRAAAALLVIAAAGGGYAGVTLSTGKSSVHNAAAVVSPSAASPATHTSSAKAKQPSLATAVARHSASGGKIAQLNVGKAASAKRSSRTAPGGGSGSGPGSTSHGGSHPLGSSSSGSGPATNGTSSSSHSLLSSGGAKNVLGKVLSPVTSTAQGITKAAGQAVQGVTNAAGQAVQGATNTAGHAVQGVTNGVGQAVGGVTNTAGKAVPGVTKGAAQTVQGVTNATGKILSGLP